MNDPIRDSGESEESGWMHDSTVEITPIENPWAPLPPPLQQVDV